MKLGLIWCEDSLRGIGVGNKIPWSVAAEMEHFKNVTDNNVVVMGRKTYESIGKPLPNRINVILTKNSEYQVSEETVDHTIIYNDIEKLFTDIKYGVFGDRKIWIIGGKEIFELFIEHADVLFVSRLMCAYDCDTYMDISLDKFKLVKTNVKLNYELNIYIKNSLKLAEQKVAHALSFF